MGKEQFYQPFDDGVPGAEGEEREIRLVRFNQTFTPFDPKQSVRVRESGLEKAATTILLDSGIILENNEVFPLLPFRFEAYPAWMVAGSRLDFTPFNWMQGYQIDERDYDQGERVKKNKEIHEALKDQNGLPPWKPFWHFKAEVTKDDLSRLKLIQGEPRIFNEFNPEAKAIVERIRLHLNFGTGMTLAGRPHPTALYQGNLIFDNFFPSDRGSLPIVSHQESGYGILWEGMKVLLPSVGTAEQIKATFTFLSENANLNM
jgi:hypothetical protein